MSKIIFDDKVYLNQNSSVADINKVNDTDMNSLKNAVNENGGYITLTAGTTDGYYYGTLEGTLSNNDIIKVNFDITGSTDNSLYLSVDGGTTYISVVDNNLIQLTEQQVGTQNVDLIYNDGVFQAQFLSNTFINSLMNALGLNVTTYDNTSNYALGVTVIYNYAIYECTTAITTPEDWNSAHWTLVPLFV